ncbi:thiol reductant ABC exporter subunit CydC [Lactococcus termiticola]|uniref:Cytochrome bd biosynthesis ABC transporter ATP-binding and permease components cydC n=1 Tax=Lactococcus termiticola TaxID=2169526 RepID=A0A2R5HEI7_9LACT|nr:thiol reductant ABC exporter subunit CydC [Lactococcus termiticola]GBG96442.1 cytochrome bd biosynthesis ABC transporter ATP-binding and permease components cydC [Lactococcus termiticola]
MNLREILFKNDWIAPFMKKFRWGLVLAVFLGTLTLICAGLLMFSGGYVISRAAQRPFNILIIYVPTLMVRVFGITRPIVHYVERLSSHNWILRITSELRKKLYLRLEKTAIGLSERVKLGDLLGILNEDIANLQDLFLRTLFPLLISGTLSIALVISAGVFSLHLAVILAIFFAILLVLVPVLSVKRTSKADEELKNYRNQLFTDMTDDVLGLEDWVLSGRKDDFLNVYREAEQGSRAKQKFLFAHARNRNLLLQAVFGILVVLLLIWGHGFLREGDAINYIAAVALTVFPLVDAYLPLSDAMVETNRYGDSVRRLDEIPEGKKEERTKEISSVKLEIKDLDFHFGDKQIFDQLNLTVEPGERVAVLGRSGVGKSTLASLIRGDLIADAGSLTLDGVAPYEAKNLEQKVAVINQSPYLFATSLRSNLTLAKLDASDEEIWHILDLVGLKEMVASLPDGLDEMVDEAGQRFSGGERQRLALARVLLSDADLVILDEPTVSLDPITENQLLELFFERLSDKTIIFITHHLLGIQHMNRVIFLEAGKIKIDGKPSDLLEENPDFKRLYALDKGLTD